MNIILLIFLSRIVSKLLLWILKYKIYFQFIEILILNLRVHLSKLSHCIFDNLDNNIHFFGQDFFILSTLFFKIMNDFFIVVYRSIDLILFLSHFGSNVTFDFSNQILGFGLELSHQLGNQFRLAILHFGQKILKMIFIVFVNLC